MLRIVHVYVLRNRFAGWWQFRRGIGSRQAEFWAQSGTPATSDCLSRLSDGCSHFGSVVGVILTATLLVHWCPFVSEEQLLREHFGPLYEALLRADVAAVALGLY